MPVVIFFRGPPGSGKGRFAQELAYLIPKSVHIESSQFLQEANYDLFEAHRHAHKRLQLLSRRQGLDLITVSGVFSKALDLNRYLAVLPEGIRVILVESADYASNPWIKKYHSAQTLIDQAAPRPIELIQNYSGAKDLL